MDSNIKIFLLLLSSVDSQDAFITEYQRVFKKNIIGNNVIIIM